MTDNSRPDNFLPMWTVYDHPLDYPEGFIARLWLVHRMPRPTDQVIVGPTLDAVRKQLPPGLYRLPREEGDDPTIVETWM